MNTKFSAAPSFKPVPFPTYWDENGVFRISINDNKWDWSELWYSDIITIEREIFFENVYCCWRDVKEDDIVVDIGASVGPFALSILQNNPQKIYCIDPSKKFIETLQKNLSDYCPDIIVPINKAIIDEETDVNEVFLLGMNDENDRQFETISFNQLIEKYSIDKINFLKIDCEGGEYDIFKDENMNFLLNNVEYIAIEIHLKYYDFRNKFKLFRDKYLSQFKDYKVMSCTRQQISWGNSIDLKDYIFDDKFIDEYDCEFMIYIWN